MITVIKYANRKLYRKDISKYTSLSELVAMPLGSFQVIDKVTGADITMETLFSYLASDTKEGAQKKVDIMSHCIKILSV